MSHPNQARGDNQTVAAIVGCHPSKIPILVRLGLLAYLNAQVDCAVKYLAIIDVLRRIAEPKWQIRATQAINGAEPTTADGVDAQPKKRTRGITDSMAPDQTAQMAADTLVRQFVKSMLIGPDGQPIPALLPDKHVARILGFRLHDLAPLRRAGVLECMNGSLKRAKKLHSREYILERAVDVAWLERATLAVNAYWRIKNARKSGGSGSAGAA